MAECKICGGTGVVITSILPVIYRRCRCTVDPISIPIEQEIKYIPDGIGLLSYIRSRDPFYVQHHETQLKIELGELERRND